MRRVGNNGKHGNKKRLRIDRLIIVLTILFVIIFITTKLLQKTTQTIKEIASNIENSQVSKLSEEYQIETLPDITISMAVIGDIMCHNTQYQSAYSNGQYDFSHVFEDIKSNLSEKVLCAQSLFKQNIFLVFSKSIVCLSCIGMSCISLWYSEWTLSDI